MYCKNCGAQLPDNAVFCTECGAQQAAPKPQPQPKQQPTYQQPQQPVYQQPVYQQPQYTPVVATPDAGPIFVTGLLSLIFAGLVGLILAIVNKKKVKEYTATGAQLTGKAKAGSILGNLGLVFSIIALVTIVIYFFVIIIGLIAGGTYASSYYDW
ncbi:MAG: zinc ribbon domain-containing protein [Clostridia bacterium]|nr:zinc ribbon domain-containing protein [Clostridia bacterium]